MKNKLTLETIISDIRVINGFKTALACLIGYLLYLFSPLPQAQWIIITILVVMSAQTSVGSLFIKAKMRFWGTVVGAVASVFIIIVCGNNPGFLAIGMFLVFLVFGIIAGNPGDISYLGTLGSVTVAIIILNPEINILTAGERFLEIILGIVISFLVSYFVFPQKSHNFFIKNLINTLIYLDEYFTQCFVLPKDFEEEVFDVNEKILGIFLQQRRLIQETGLEFGKSRKDKIVFQKILNHERKVYRGINLIYYSLASIPDSKDKIQQLLGFEQFRIEYSQLLNQLANALKTGSVKETNFVMTNLTEYMDRDFKSLNQVLEEKHIANAHVFLFGVKFLMKEIEKLAQAIKEINYLGKNKF